MNDETAGKLRALRLVGLVGIIGLLLVPLPIGGRIGDLAHAPVFGFLAVMLLGEVRRRWHRPPGWLVLGIWVVVVLFGGLIELIQSQTGRQPSWHDIQANALGAAAFLIAASIPKTATRHLRISILAIAIVMLVIPSIPPLLIVWDYIRQHIEVPCLSSFEQPLELSRWEFDESRAERSGLHATEGDWSLRVDLGPGVYPAATLISLYRDWSGYRALEFDIYLETEQPLDLVVKIEDMEHTGKLDDRFHGLAHLVHGPNHIRIALADVERGPRNRRLNLQHIRKLQLFAIDLKSTVTIYLDSVRLK